MAVLERNYQAWLIKRIEARFPGCFIMKNDPQYRQGTPDLTILHGPRWAVLEVKRNVQEIENASQNQHFYVGHLNQMGYCSFICPELEEEVLDEIQRAFES